MEINNSTYNWKKYWETKDFKNYRKQRLSSYQIPVYDILENLISGEKITSILSAGAGLDLISLRLQKRFKNNLDITILDISEEVLEVNKKLFENNNLNAHYEKANIFEMQFKSNNFDLIFNTGLLEHFNYEEQKLIAGEILRVLKPSGYFITANTCNTGKIYRFGMAAAKRKNEWEYGREVPVKSLKFLQRYFDNIEYIEEFPKDFFTQLYFLKYVNKIFKVLFRVVYYLFCYKYILKIIDALFIKLFGSYLIISIIKKSP